jgi:hypothetical protein
VPFFAPEEHRDGDLLLRPWQPGDGEELNRATVASYEHLRRFMEWPSPDTTVEDSEGATSARAGPAGCSASSGTSGCGAAGGWSAAPAS